MLSDAGEVASLIPVFPKYLFPVSTVPTSTAGAQQAGREQKAARSINSLVRFYHFKENKLQLIALVGACTVLALLA